MDYNFKEIEAKWQKYWKDNGVYTVTEDPSKPKYYVLDMFPYPSGSGLHVGHPKGYVATDVFSRFKRMQGFNVLHPMGWDAFGLPAENYAIANKIHPKVAMEKNIKVFKRQLEKIGFNFDWSREISTTDPEFYKWTQWAVARMFEKGLMEEVDEPIIWCPKCKTGLALEDLEDGKCERCKSDIEKKKLRQWIIKITKYADRLLEGLDELDWDESIKEMQRNWIGRSEGLLFTAPVKDMDLEIQTFSAHFEACYADTFVAIAPDHPLLKTLIEEVKNKDEILEFANMLIQKRLAKGYEDEKDVEGIFTGRYLIDPLGNGDLPIWIASFALADYGTGIVKCSAHDERDFIFAKKYNIPLKPVLFPEDPEERKKVESKEICFFDMKKGILMEPEFLKGKRAGESSQAIIEHLEEKGWAKRKINYRLRDWVFARQRYWGEPFPFIHKEDGSVVVVPDKELPVELPEVEHYEPTGTGESPLANIKEWVETPEGKRETNTMPQWAGSSWYYLRYIDPKNNEKLIDKKKEQYWMGKEGIDLYVGGVEHATRHLIYARFWHKFLYDIGVVSTKEPFHKLINTGLILAEDGRKMSKRWDNVVNPDDVIEKYGADSFRLYEMFIGPFTQAANWSTKGVEGPYKFLERFLRLFDKKLIEKTSQKQKIILHKTIKKVGKDIENFHFNTAISALMIAVNELTQEKEIGKDVLYGLTLLLAPFTPHLSEELCKGTFQKKESVIDAAWPEYDEALTVDEEITIAVQVNGKLRESFKASKDISEEDAIKEAKSLEKIQKYLKKGNVVKEIYIPGKLVNIVIK